MEGVRRLNILRFVLKYVFDRFPAHVTLNLQKRFKQSYFIRICYRPNARVFLFFFLF